MNVSRKDRTRLRRSLVSLGIGLLLALGRTPMPATAGAVGVSPLSLDYADAPRGATLVQTLILSNEPSQGDSGTLSYTLTAKGETAEWIKFLPAEGDKPLTKLDVPEAKQAFVRVVVSVPAQAANRTYTGSVYIEGATVKADSKPGDVGVGTAQEVPVTVKVGGVERREASVDDFVVDQAEVGLKQRFTAKVSNKGNVTVAGELDVKVSRAGSAVATLSTKGSNFPILPGVSDGVTIDWDTSEQLGGDYTAEFTVRDVSGIAPVVLGTKTVPFRLEPRGTFTRSGKFASFELLDKFVQGDLVRAEAGFFNTGKIPTNAVLDSQIFFKGKQIKEVQSLPRLVRPGATGRIVVSFDAVDAGTYTIKSTFNFDGEVTDVKELKVDVAPNGKSPSSKGSDGGSSNTGVLALAGVGVLAVVGGGWVIARRRRRTD